MVSIPEEELSRRRIAWEALSELFLDTELSETDFDRIARSLRDSKYSIEQLDSILRNELAPLLFGNCAPGRFGEWAGFDVGAIERDVLAGKHLQIRHWSRFLQRRACRSTIKNVVEPDWQKIVLRLKAASSRSA